MSWEEVACRPVGLPADRNVRLYDAGGRLVGAGAERSKRSEPVEEPREPGQYRIRVSGFDGAADPVHHYQLKLGTESLHLSELSSFGAANGTIWIAGTTRAGRELLLRIVHAGREPARVSVWSERTSVANEPATGELKLR